MTLVCPNLCEDSYNFEYSKSEYSKFEGSKFEGSKSKCSKKDGVLELKTEALPEPYRGQAGA
jgi:hypothetical protein